MSGQLYIHFELRGETGGVGGTTTVEVFWNGVSKGTVESEPVPDHAADPWRYPWFAYRVPVESISGEKELNFTRVAGQNAHFRNVWIEEDVEELNGDFETDVSGWHAANDAGYGPTIVERSTAWSAEGAASLRCVEEVGMGAWHQVESDSFGVTEGQLLSLQFKKHWDGAYSGTYHCGFKYFDENGDFLVGADVMGGPQADDSWSTASQTVPEGAASAAVFLHALAAPGSAYFDAVRVGRVLNLGEFPLGFPYTAPIVDGEIGGAPLINDGAAPWDTYSGAGYVGEHGLDREPSLFNHVMPWHLQTPGSHVQDYDGWINHGGIWVIQPGFGALQSGYENPPQGDPLFNLMGHDCFPVTRPDGFYGAPHHHVSMAYTTAGSRGISNVGPIWGWNSWDDYFFCWVGGHDDQGIYHVQGGVPTLLGSVSGGFGFGGSVSVEHDFLTGDLHVVHHDNFFGENFVYDGNHPHTVGTGAAGWMVDRQNAGIFGDTTSCVAWQNVFDPGHVAYRRQWSMQDAAAIASDPLTWWFKGTDRPKLRWRQRDDQRARSIRNQPKSRQRSDRQGWENTYL